MSAVVRENKSLESVSDKLPRACGRHYAVIQRLSVAEEVLPFPVDLGCSGTFIPAISYPENPGTPPILLQPPLGRRVDVTKPDLFVGLYWRSKNHFACWESGSLVLTQHCESEAVETNKSSLEDTAKDPKNLCLSF